MGSWLQNMKRVPSISKISIKLLLVVVVSFFTSIFIMSEIQPYIKNLYFFPNLYKSIHASIISGLLIYIIGIASFVLIFVLIINREIKYIKYISKQVKKIANEDFGATIEIRGKDELAELCENINIMSRELKSKFEKEREIEKIKTEFITNVSHDLRTPLTSIIGYMDFLKNEKFKSEKEEKEYINSAYNLSNKLKSLIDQLFEFTKLSDSEVKLDLIEADICAILNQILGEYAPILDEKDLKIVADIPENELIIKIDVEKIVRVFENILNNAEKYSYKPSEVIVNLESKDGAVIISFSNKCHHISKDNINKMFERFYRNDISRSNNVPGSGLGLAISKKIIELHGGEIWAESNKEIISFNVKLKLNK